MKIDELTGYRNNPIYQIALNSPSVYRFETNMKEQGYSKHILGSGLYGVVFEKPGTNFVYKLFDVDDTGYKAYLNFAQQNQNNIHIPKIGKPLKLKIGSINAYLVKLERLEEVNLSNPQHEQQYKKIIAIISSLEKIKTNNPMRSGAMNFLKKVDKTDPDLVNIIEDINDISPSEMDMHPGNVMMRGNVIIITDPYAGGSFPMSA